MPSRLTFSTVLNSTLPQAIGQCAQNRTDIVAFINEAQQRLIADPLAPDEGWWGGWVTMLFTLQVTGHIAYVRTPQEIARIIVLDVCDRPRFIRNGFYEYLQFGTGHRPKGCSNNCCDTMQAFDRPNVPTLVDFPTNAPQKIRVYPTDAADVGKRVIVQGPDQNGIPVLGTDVATGVSNQGETLILQFPFTDSLNTFQDVTGLLKDVTKGFVRIFTVDPTTHAQVSLSSMDPNETTASYRQYLFAGLPDHCCNRPSGSVQVVAQCRLDFQPVAADTDYLIIQNLPALKEECQAIKYSTQDSQQSPALEAKHHAKAISLLNGELDLYEGKVRTAISVPIFGSQRLRPQPV